MPALYRMPVFYVLLLILAGLYATFRPAPPPPEVAPAPEVVVSPLKIPDNQVEVEGGSTSDGILRTADGLRRKVVVKDLAVGCRSEPRGGKVVGRPLDYFAIRYVFARRAAGGPSGLVPRRPSRRPAAGVGPGLEPSWNGTRA